MPACIMVRRSDRPAVRGRPKICLQMTFPIDGLMPRLGFVTTRVLVGGLDPLVARGLIQTLRDEHFEVYDASGVGGVQGLLDEIGRVHPDAVIVRMAADRDATVTTLIEQSPGVGVIECDDDRPRLRGHPVDGAPFVLEPVTALTLREALRRTGARSDADVH
jgi:hypothetical protein